MPPKFRVLCNASSVGGDAAESRQPDDLVVCTRLGSLPYTITQNMVFFKIPYLASQMLISIELRSHN